MSERKALVDEKIERFKAAVRLEPHDRVPVAAMSDFWPVGMQSRYTMQQAFYDIDMLGSCYREAFTRWHDWDAFSAILYSLGQMLDATGSKRYAVPGRDISPDAEFQHPDLSLMGPEEYPKLIADPMKFQLEEIVPRLCGRIGSSDRIASGKAMAKAALFFGQWMAKARAYAPVWVNEFGIPPMNQGTALYNPMDWIADKLRGFRQGLIDIRQRPEEVAEACEALVPFILNVGLATAPAGGEFPLLFNPQHVSPFIGPKQYEKVYWPTFKRLVDEYVSRGYSVWVVFESNQEQHLEKMQDLPKGRIVAHLESTDLTRAKKALGGKICIAGGMPSALLAKGTPEEVAEQTRSVLALFEDEPGFIMTCSTTLPSNARPENLDAWLDTMRKLGHIGAGATKERTDAPAMGHSRASQALGEIAQRGIMEWGAVKADFGEILGDEGIIRDKWEEMERLITPFIYWLIK